MRGDDIANSAPFPLDEQAEEFYAADVELSSSTQSQNSDYQQLIDATAAVDLAPNHATPPNNTMRAVGAVSYSRRVVGVPNVRMGMSSGSATSTTATAPSTFFRSMDATSHRMSLLNGEDHDTGYGTSGSLEMNLGRYCLLTP